MMHIERLVSEEELEETGLSYVDETEKGITRRRCGKGYAFITAEGEVVKDDDEKNRLLKIAVPPSYENIWYCPDPNGHLQATGYDSQGKKQYFYHALWASLRDHHKFALMVDFGTCLPAFRRHVRRRMKNTQSEKELLIGCMLRILDRTGVRIGNLQSAHDNHTYGLTTLLKKHVSVEGKKLRFQFTGKGGADITFVVSDPVVTELVTKRLNLPGIHLFQYRDEQGESRFISPQDINDFIQAKMGTQFSAKDFRTWRFSHFFLEAMLQANNSEKVTLTSLLDSIALKTCNTSAVLKSSYIHPGLLTLCKQGDFKSLRSRKNSTSGLTQSEACLLAYVKSKDAKQALEDD